MIFVVLAGTQNLSAFPTGSGSPLAGRAQPTYPIDTEVYTTIHEAVYPTPLPNPPTLPSTVKLFPRNYAECLPYGYGEWDWVPGSPYVKPVLSSQNDPVEPSVRDPQAATLVSFFAISDIHITDKESPTQLILEVYNTTLPQANSCGYPASLSTTHVLDAAVQTINALHQTQPFDCGISLGDACTNAQYNELRWFMDVLDGKWITPSSGAHAGAATIGYQKPYQAAGLNPAIPWYQAVGNHDQFWLGSAVATPYLLDAYVGTDLLDLGLIPNPPDFYALQLTQGYYQGIVNGATELGTIINYGKTSDFPMPPQIVADAQRRMLTINQWMAEFNNTTSKPAGHGFTQQMIREGFACYHFYPRADMPLKVIVLDDTGKSGGVGGGGELDAKRYNWLIKELNAGEAKGELMVICSHVPVLAYGAPPAGSPGYPVEMFTRTSPVTEDTLLAKLHTYKNLILWMAGHQHRSTITPQPAPNGDPAYGFWEVETPSLRDFPQQFRSFEIVRNSDATISIFARDVDASLAAPLAGQPGTPAWNSRTYAIAAEQIVNYQVDQGPNVDPHTGVYNAELVKTLSPAMQAKIARLSPIVRIYEAKVNYYTPASVSITLNNTITGSTPTYYIASESPKFTGATWQPYSQSPTVTISLKNKTSALYFKVKDGSGRESARAQKPFYIINGRINWGTPPATSPPAPPRFQKIIR
jgi:metallophosphoesterase (TIGR03768 family)